jgi:ABC-type glycerol-3-phosphate transport system substrate-binding protein
MSHASTKVTRRRFLGGALGAAAAVPAVARRAGAQAKPTITYWNGLTGADGKVMDALVDQFTKETGINLLDPPRGDPALRERRHPRSHGRGHAGG